MKEAGQKLQKVILSEISEKADEILDVGISFDGTWTKRGFTSLTDVVFVISINTGEVLDYHVLSKTCKKCTLKKPELSDEQFEESLLEHECDINYLESSLAMETEGAIVLWQRSVETHNMRYKWMVSDGDSKAHSSGEDVYGDIKVEKLDCVDHMQKSGKTPAQPKVNHKRQA